MRRLIEVVESSNFEATLGENVFITCCRFFYAGELTGVNDTCIELTNPEIVYETGHWREKGWKNSEKIAKKVVIMLASIESWLIVE